MPKRLFYILTLIVILLACAAPPRPTSPLPPSPPRPTSPLLPSQTSSYQAQHIFDICKSALPSGLYLQRIRITTYLPRTCKEKIEDLESEIFSLQSELDDLERECSD